MPSQISNPLLFPFSDRDDDSVEIYDDEQDHTSRSTQKSHKLSGACVDCKSVKVRCELVTGEKKCRRCQTRNLPCHPRERKKRKAADTHEQLMERAHEQDIQIQNLLLKYDQLRSEQKLNQWISAAPHANNGDGMANLKWIQKGKSPESAATSYFSSRSRDHQLIPPDIIKHCGLYPEEIIELFSIFFSRVNPYFSVLDEDYHTPERLIWSSPFLFTVVCAVASRYHTSRTGLYQLAMEFARDLAGKALVEGAQSVEICQAYLILAVYPVPKKKWAEDRSWLLMGVAIRMAIELELNDPPPPECDEREALNRTRTWLNCYCVDGLHAIHFGKIPMLRLDDFLARHSRDWYKSSPFNTPFDVHLCACVQMIIQMAKWRVGIMADTPNPVADPETLATLAIETQESLTQELEQWIDNYAEEYAFMPLPIFSYRANTTQMLTSYLKLVVLLVGFQSAKKEDLHRHSQILLLSIDAARTVIQIMLERLYPTGYLRFAVEANFVYVSFAAAFLINLFRRRFLHLLDDNLRREIILIVSRLVAVLGSSDVALDGRHTPALYSRFLSSLMAKHHANFERLDARSPSNSLSGSPSPNTVNRLTTPSNAFYWPDIPQNSLLRGPNIQGFSQDIACQHQRELDMDFSLSHFINTVSQQATPSTNEVDAAEFWETWSHSAPVSNLVNELSNI
ncbi:fungal-specific transcription factor domain-containing protein [Crassisporium funariophilum]|nr:fungal-specific transcription factor domain-containing protein [Crassisporium funariophilum]